LSALFDKRSLGPEVNNMGQLLQMTVLIFVVGCLFESVELKYIKQEKLRQENHG